MRRLRYPRLARIEDAIEERIRNLKLPAAIALSVPPGLEGGALRVEFQSVSPAELKMLALSLATAADRDSVREIFDLLSGEACLNEPVSGS